MNTLQPCCQAKQPGVNVKLLRVVELTLILPRLKVFTCRARKNQDIISGKTQCINFSVLNGNLTLTKGHLACADQQLRDIELVIRLCLIMKFFFL